MPRRVASSEAAKAPKAYDHRRVIDDRGNELLVVKKLSDAEKEQC